MNEMRMAIKFYSFAITAVARILNYSQEFHFKEQLSALIMENFKCEFNKGKTWKFPSVTISESVYK